MTRYLLDTNVVSDLMRSPASRALSRIQAVGQDNVYVSVVVAGELRFGAAKKGSKRLLAEVENMLDRLSIAPLQASVDAIYAAARAELEDRGTPIGANDLWIAAQALHDRSVLVTDKMREFGRVPELKIENWLRPDED